MKAIIVLGPESTGTRLAMQILLANGCAGDAGHWQAVDDGSITSTQVAWRRSVPHRGQELDLEAMLAKLEGYEVQLVVTIRAWRPTEVSQVANTHSATEEQARQKVALAYASIMDQVTSHELPFTFLVYEALVLHPRETQEALLEELGLPCHGTVPILDGNGPRWHQIQQQLLEAV